jgi:hypothetical protein
MVCLIRSTAGPSSPRTSSAFQSTWSRVLETTYFLAASIDWAKGDHPLRPTFARRRRPPRRLHHLVGDAAEEKGVGAGDRLGPVAMKFFVGGAGFVVAAAVEGDVDGVAEMGHGGILERA